jgi:quinolinate synthase
MPDAGATGALAARLTELKLSRRAVILAHNYQLGEVQDAADFVGDSLELSRLAAATEAETIVFCGVHFMAETAAILSPQKTVLLPVLEADCPMARMIDAAGLRRMKAEHPAAAAVCYVNTTAEVKAECDVCCTSANAERVVASIPREREILFVPDQYLGAFVRARTGRDMVLWPGHCPTHARILPRHAEAARARFPHAKLIAHPECRPDVTALADAVLSTGGMIRFARETEAEEILVGTEVGIIHRLQRENPGKRFIPVTEQAICPNMKRIELADVVRALENLEHRIVVPEPIRVKAAAAVARMLAVAA